MLLKKLVKPENNSFRILFFSFGLFFVIVASIIFLFTFTPVFKAEVKYQLTKKNEKPLEVNPVNPEFSIIIPKINVNVKVIKNVDAFDSKIYQPALTQGVAHAKNTSTPDQVGNTFIFAHSAGNWYQANQFNAVFYLLNKLETGDEIIVFYQSQKYNYIVKETKKVKGNESSYMLNSSNQKQLTLMTCWPPGTTLNRLIVIANQK